MKYTPAGPVVAAHLAAIKAATRARIAAAHAAGKQVHFVITNDPTSGVSQAQLARIVLGCALQLQRDVAPEYGLLRPIVELLATGQPRPMSTDAIEVIALSVLGKIPLDPTAQGWHQPLHSGEAFDGYISTEGLDLDGLSECLGHELIEAFVDPMCSKVYVAANGDRYPEEPCDACQAAGRDPNLERVPIRVDDGAPVMCPNFVLRAWGIPGLRAKKDFLGQLPPDVDFPIGPHGYCAIGKADGSEVDVFGADGERVELPAHKQVDHARVQVRMTTMRGAA